MKFTDGFWHTRPGVDAHYAREVARVISTDDTLGVTAPTRVVTTRGNTLNLPIIKATLSAPLENVIRVRLVHHAGGRDAVQFAIDHEDGVATTTLGDTSASLASGGLVAHIDLDAPWNLRFEGNGTPLTQSGHKSVAWARVAENAAVEEVPIGIPRTAASNYVFSQLDLGVGEYVYGLGERFGPFVKNGQTVDMWNADGGTSSEQAYKNIPFYMTNRGYGVFVNDPGFVSFEVASEAVERVQFAVEGESLEYFVIYGPDPKTILERYTALTGRPATVPAWTYGLWLTTSFTTEYDEATVNSFIDGMFERELPLSVFHFDCFWMREYNWCDFEWDPRTFPDPEGMLGRLHQKDLKVCVWINSYIGQESPLFEEGKQAGFLVKRADGSVWQWDRWQAGMALVDFTNPDATAWFKDKLRALINQGVDCFKTDFGERIPVDVAWADGSDPKRMHNLYTHLYNKAVHEVLVEERGEGEAVLFARSATAGGQQFPIHWGGDSTSTFASMAETLRGGLSLALSGFGFWSHDIGGFEGTPDTAVFKRWTAFGLLSSHSRFHGSDSYRVPWMFDDDEDHPESAVSVTRRFSKLKNRLIPYLLGAGREANSSGTPVMRPMMLEFPGDRTAEHLDRQYMLGQDLLVAPVFTASGDVEFYLPHGEWVHLLSGTTEMGGRWIREQHGFDSLPVYVRPGAVIALGARDDRPDSNHLEGLTLLVHPDDAPGWTRTVDVAGLDGRTARFTVRLDDGQIVAESDVATGWSIQRVGGDPIEASDGRARL
jgi:alpha-D-xyloside xylohydrolase